MIEKLCQEEFSREEALSLQEREAFLMIVQKAAFSEETVSPEEYDTFRKLCGRLESATGKKAGKLRRVYLKLTGRYGKI